ncbi:uncharacterized protein LOC117964235 isoform X1 [Acipenser ruthenus]|uniref:uncharacterized protein LOC117964235 isoform X1 n=1 Tax=Acipenser ruthenus TaxID=7906 RepID=UPI002741F8FD|nr:uncharacterized protein LOC117964235 isoform X1 [Acipenser ruthenus]XP_058851264.1 uncharacterized protein LOC117964235 isoform X1 [Acipenser ruthenus]XP_058851265.1 uncharacterized protein LOC117964235 isoform X1 [Acipenser ruthenus]
MENQEEPSPEPQTEKENQKQTVPSNTGSNPTAERVCRFYSQGRHCHFGRRCRFLHQWVEAKGILKGAENKTDNTLSINPTEDGKLNDSANTVLEYPEQVQNTGQVSTVRDFSSKCDQPSLNNKASSGRKERPRRPCRYFLSGNCAMEDRCRFWHPEQLPSLKDDSDQRERERGTTERPWPPIVRPSAIREEVKLSEFTEELSKQLRETEINQLSKRFPKDRLIVQEREDGKVTYYRVTVQPTDPDWPFDLKDIDIMVSFPDEYPLQVFSLEIPEDQDLPSIMGRHVCKASEEWVQAKHATNELMGKVELLFRPFLRWLDRNLEKLFTEGARLLKRDIEAERSGIEFVPYEQLKVTSPSSTERTADPSESCGEEDSDADSHSDCEGEQEESCGADGPSSGVDGEGGATSHCVENVKSTEPRKGTEVKLMGLHLGEGTATVVASRITVSLQCSRCKITADLTMARDHPYTAQCEKCSAHISATFRPSMLHHYSAVLGYLDLSAAVPVDLVLQDCELVVGCLSCSKEEPLQNVLYGQNKEFNCLHCHSKLSILVETTRFQYLQPRSRNERGDKGSLQQRPKFHRDPAVQPGKPLPQKGTCRHYKQSYRWLRFPCCGRAYPCDTCHDEDQNHEMELATRMICGYCAKEQPYTSGKPCISCGSMVIRGPHSSHWEGGQGCRNKIKMCRNDRQKYANTGKTVSRKSASQQK